MTAATPTRDQFTSPDQFIVHVDRAATPDGFNRVQFFAYWPTDQECVPGGVRAQVFHADLDDFVRRARASGQAVRIIRTEEGS